MKDNFNNILFRTDSSSSIGTGHVMRDLVLADQFIGANVIFATQNLSGNINDKIKDNGYQIENLISNDVEEVIKMIRKFSIDMIVIDSYNIDINFEIKLKEKTNIKIFVFDDNYQKHLCDILLNHNIYGDKKKYKELVPAGCELRCGVEFTLLREEFIKEKQKCKNIAESENIKNIFLAMGGTDHSNKSIKILHVLNSFSDIHVNVVTTTGNQYLLELEKYVKNKKNISLYINTNRIAELMNNADFAIVSPSVIMNEVFYLGVPFIAIKTTENQNNMYEFLVDKKYLTLEKFNETGLRIMVKDLLNSQNIELKNFVNLSLDEKKIILEWRNNPGIRKWMFTKDEIMFSEHIKFIESLKKTQNKLYFLVKRENQNIGVIDFSNINKGKNTKFGIYVNPGLKGMGNLLMNLIIDYGFKVLNVNNLISEVYEDNCAALNLYNRFYFKRIGMKKIDNGNILCMELKNDIKE